MRCGPHLGSSSSSSGWRGGLWTSHPPRNLAHHPSSKVLASCPPCHRPEPLRPSPHHRALPASFSLQHSFNPFIFILLSLMLIFFILFFSHFLMLSVNPHSLEECFILLPRFLLGVHLVFLSQCLGWALSPASSWGPSQAGRGEQLMMGQSRATAGLGLCPGPRQRDGQHVQMEGTREGREGRERLKREGGAGRDPGAEAGEPRVLVPPAQEPWTGRGVDDSPLASL